MKKYILFLCAFFCLLGSVGCQRKNPSFSRSGFALNTAVSVTVYDVPKATADKALAASFEEIERLEALLSVTREGSDIEKLNKANGQVTEISNETPKLLYKQKNMANFQTERLT